MESANHFVRLVVRCFRPLVLTVERIEAHSGRSLIVIHPSYIQSHSKNLTAHMKFKMCDLPPGVIVGNVRS